MDEVARHLEVGRKAWALIGAGLCSGLGRPEPGHMCVEALICYVQGEKHSDKPTCVDPVLREFKIDLNDRPWSSNIARAEGLRHLAIAQLGSLGHMDSKVFVTRMAELTIREIIPQAMRDAAKACPGHAAALEAAAKKCEAEGTADSACEARTIARAAYASSHAVTAAYAASAAYASYASTVTTAVAYAAATAEAAAAAAANPLAADQARDTVLKKSADIAVRVLRELAVPGIAVLDILLSEQNSAQVFNYHTPFSGDSHA